MSNDIFVPTHLIRQSYHPFSSLTEALGCFLEAAMGATQSSHGEILLKDSAAAGEETVSGVSIAGNRPSELIKTLPINQCALCVNLFEPDRGKPSRPKPHCARFSELNSHTAAPIRYQGAVIGLLALGSERSGHYTERRQKICESIAGEIAHHVKRYETNEKMKARFREDLMLIGISDAMRSVDDFIEKASPAPHPALILGEFGLEKRHIAYALHLSGQADRPFVEVNCAGLDPVNAALTLPHHLSKAKGGTMFFDGIDQLEYGLQRTLWEIIQSEVGISADPRLIASGGVRLEEPIDETAVYRPLLAKFDYLLTRVLPLRERREDIKPLTEFFLNKHSNRSNRRVAFSHEVLSAFETYDWPRNLYELERVVARLAVMSESELIQMTDIQRQVPGLANKAESDATSVFYNPPVEREEVVEHSKIDPKLAELARALIKQDFTEIKSFHPSLQHALEYLAQNLHEPITLHELCRHSGLSPSHLAYLFQKTMGVNFKLFLSLVRIEEAKQLLAEHPHMRITEVSFNIGFGDLRHFERTFRRLVGKSPREYRQLGLDIE